MNIFVERGDWGGAQINDIQKLLGDVANQFTKHFSDLPNQVIRVQYNAEGPRINYRNLATDDYIVLLSARDQF